MFSPLPPLPSELLERLLQLLDDTAHSANLPAQLFDLGLQPLDRGFAQLLKPGFQGPTALFHPAGQGVGLIVEAGGMQMFRCDLKMLQTLTFHLDPLASRARSRRHVALRSDGTYGAHHRFRAPCFGSGAEPILNAGAFDFGEQIAEVVKLAGDLLSALRSILRQFH